MKRPQFSTRALLLTVFVCAVISLVAKKYVDRREDFVAPPPDQRVVTIATQWALSEFNEKGVAFEPSRLNIEHPPLGLDYWIQRAEAIEPGMHTLAIYKYLPPVTGQCAYLNPRLKQLIVPGDKLNQVLVYGVDSQLAAICEVTCETGTPEDPNPLQKVVKFLGFVDYKMRLNDNGTIAVSSMAIEDGSDRVDIVFANGGSPGTTRD